MKDIKKLALGPNDFYHRLGPLSCRLISVAVVAVEGGGEVGRWGGGEVGRRGGGEVGRQGGDVDGCGSGGE
jgi:hypothetical protein